MDWREALRTESETRLSELVRADREFQIDAEQPVYRGGTHYVTFGTHRGRPAVFKFFVAARRWRNEAACLAHYQDSGLVPRVFYQEPETLIVMERLQGGDVLNVLASRPFAPAEADELSRQIGTALARLTMRPPALRTTGYDPRTDFPDWGWNLGIANVVGRVLRLGSGVVERADPCYRRILGDSLVRLAERLPVVEREARVLFHEDVSNLRVEGTRFLAFYDLELCRDGTVSMQLGAALGLCVGTRLEWESLVEAFEARTGVRLTRADHRSILAMSDLSRWIRILSNVPDGEVSGGPEGPSPAVAEAESYADSMVAAELEIRPFL